LKKFVVVPTYNESTNIRQLIDKLFDLGLENFNVVVVDDNSPDGTSRIVEELLPTYPNLYLVERLTDRGRGTAGIVGFDFALKNGADALVEMDADFSHPPQDLPKLFDALSLADIAIASRLHKESRDSRPMRRRILTMIANRYARFFMERPKHKSTVKDWTTGFRAYRKEVFETVPPYSLVSQGPSILQEILLRALNSGLTAIEIPFTMKDRQAGQSTFNKKIARQSLFSIPCYRILFENLKTFRLPEQYLTQQNKQRHITIQKKEDDSR